jgi:hypothetical protein
MVWSSIRDWERRKEMEKAKPVVALILAVMAAAAVVSVVVTPRAESSDTGEIGRYQLVTGCYEGTVGEGLPDKGDGIILRRGFFRLDTATGRTWVLNEYIDTSSIIETEYDMEWVPID